jgi:modification methylase
MTNLPQNTILHGDCIPIMQDLPAESIDVVFADPPYNMQLKQPLWRPDNTHVDPVDDAWDEFGGFGGHDAFTRAWLRAAQRLLKPRSSIWVCGTYHSIYRVGSIMQDLGYWLMNGIAWYKRDATPNFNGTRLKNDVEFLIWAKRDEKAQYTFNYQPLKQFNAGKQLGSMWDIPKVKRHEQLLDADGTRIHSTQKPEALLERVIVASTRPGDVILDPFFGSGTTGAVAKKLHRRWLGIELEADYIPSAQARIDAVTPLPDDDPLMQPAVDHVARRVSFKTLIKEGYLDVGQTLYLKGADCAAEILPNGKLRSGEQVGTIHILCRHLLDVPSCNGWKIWLYEDADGERRPINHLREQYRRANGVE